MMNRASDIQPDRTRYVWLVLLLLCLGSRLLTTIYYVADPDSLRFALAIIDYDLTRLQPHFPGYPVFVVIAKAIHAATGSFAISFSIVGGFSVFVLIWGTLGIMHEPPLTPRGSIATFLLFFNPLIWIMSNRYMPDLMGLACAVAALYLIVDRSRWWHPAAGMFLVGVLAGIRLSYLPLLVVPVAIVLFRQRLRVQLLLAGILGLLVWFVPFILSTGWNELLAAARLQTEGHFNDFGGTIQTDADLLARTSRFIENVVADGLGGWWPGRHWVTAVVSVGTGVMGVLGAWQLWPQMRRDAMDRGVSVLAGAAGYAIWIFLYQNVIYQNRHLLPLLPFVLIVVAVGACWAIRRFGVPAIAATLLLLAAYGYVCSVLVDQHRQPTAVAQLTEYLRLRSMPGTYIISAPLIAYMLTAQNVDGVYHEVKPETMSVGITLPPAADDVIVIGDYQQLLPGVPASTHIFYHNPYVNRVWERLPLYEYRREAGE